MAEQEQQGHGTQAAPTTTTGMDPKLAGLLCYLFGLITGLIFYFMEKEDRTVRFHAMQSIISAKLSRAVPVTPQWASSRCISHALMCC